MGEYSNCDINDFDIMLEMFILISDVKRFFENIVLESHSVLLIHGSENLYP